MSIGYVLMLCEMNTSDFMAQARNITVLVAVLMPISKFLFS